MVKKSNKKKKSRKIRNKVIAGVLTVSGMLGAVQVVVTDVYSIAHTTQGIAQML